MTGKRREGGKMSFTRPEDIEAESFRIIAEEMKEKGISIPGDEAPVTMRVIHTTADFDYSATLAFSKGAAEKLSRLLKQGTRIVTDTNMAKSGINKGLLSGYGGEVLCFMAEKNVASEAAERGITRAMVSMERATSLTGDTVYVIGNAPTALMLLKEKIEEDGYRPAFIVGVPVGFVNVVKSKEEIRKTAETYGIPYIINMGRKGGSNVAAAIINAALKML